MSSNEVLNFEAIKEQAINDLKAGKSLLGEGGALMPLIKQIMEASLESELEYHLEECESLGKANRRNGKTSKQVKSGEGEFELTTPRDREGSFEPQLVKKRQTVLNASLDKKVLALYGLGMSYEGISQHLQEMYGVEASGSLISRITDQLLPLITEWRNRPLEAIYPIVFLDAMFFKSRDNGKVLTKAMYTILGVNQQGYKDILGFYLAESEGAHFWLGVLNDLKARGVEDIFLACVDGLTGFPEAIAAAFPKTDVQLCVIHQIRHSLRYVASKDKKLFMGDLKLVYQADTKAMAEHHLLELGEKWGKRYPMVIKSWQSKWDPLSTYFHYAPEVRRLIYTTNVIEGFHRQVRKYTKTKGAFTSENALIKLIYSAYQRIKEKWSQPLHNWALTISQLDIYFPERVKIEL